MDIQTNHNPLIEIAELGFSVTWKLIDLGLTKSMDKLIEAFLALDDVVAYLQGMLGDNPNQTDAIISVLCEDQDHIEMRRVISRLAQEESTDRYVQLRKWRALSLRKLLNEIEINMDNDPNGHCELIWFWSTGLSLGDHPMTIPQSNAEEIKAFYSKEGAQKAIEENEAFLTAEINALSLISDSECGL